MTAALDDLPGFRRRFVVTPGPGRVQAELEDDYHHMQVTLRHDGMVAHGIDPVMLRAPWTTCPGAPAMLVRTFTGVALAAFVARGEKLTNCTHLHDLATLAAAHAFDAAPTVFDILVSDPVDGHVRAELRRNGAPVLGWRLRGWTFEAPAAIAGMTIDKLRPWIETLDSTGQEHARLLRWGTILANGRAMSLAKRSDKSRLPYGQCYTFQPENAPDARYVAGTVKDFSDGADGPLAARGRAAIAIDHP